MLFIYFNTTQQLCHCAKGNINNMDYAIKNKDVTKILREQVLSIEEEKEKSEWYKLIKQNGGSNRVHRFLIKIKIYW